MHISGAEGIYENHEITAIVRDYTLRALNHQRGSPQKIVITVEKIQENPIIIPFLPVKTLLCHYPEQARQIIVKALAELGVSGRSAHNAFKVLSSAKTMRGASLIFVRTGRRVEPDRNRGVRVSHLGIDASSVTALKQKLSKMRINTTTVREALAIASKVASHPDVVAEVCISDDPDYTTGYIASRQCGYMRIPNIKHSGDMNGGRVFFIQDETDIHSLIEYLEQKPVFLGFRTQGSISKLFSKRQRDG
jgi:6-carboxyhexanoate--CoA ligase